VGISDPREFIAAESQRIPFKAALSKPSLWQDAFKNWPLPPIVGWRNWYKRVLADNSANSGVNAFLFGHGPMSPTLADVYMITITLHFVARDAELNQLKMLEEQLADKVNARGDAPAECLAAVENRVDEVATHDIRLGTTLGLAAMATHTGVDYSTRRDRGHLGAPRRPRRRYCRTHSSPVCAKQAL
jgi:hypothetical protein